MDFGFFAIDGVPPHAKLPGITAGRYNRAIDMKISVSAYPLTYHLFLLKMSYMLLKLWMTGEKREQAKDPIRKGGQKASS